MRNGFAVPVVLLFLVALALLGGTATLLTTSELRIGGLYSSTHRAFDASGSGLDHALVVFADTGSTAAAWPVEGRVESFAYRVELARDTFDFGAGRGPVSLDESGPGAAFNTEGRGDSVYVLTATATRGLVRATQRQWLSTRSVPRLPAAITIQAAGATEWVGGGAVSGLNVDATGTPVAPADPDTAAFCGRNRPALHVARDSASRPVVSLSSDGNDSFSGHSPPFTTAGPDRSWNRPEDVLGARPGSLDGFRRRGFLHGMVPPDTLSNVVWITDEAGGPTSCLTGAGCGHLEGSGILIIHNPRYDPRQHDPTDPRYDPLIAADPAHGPARLRNVTGGSFHGILIVDELPRVTTGPIRIRGAVVELSRRSAPARFEWPAATSIEYSCETIMEAVRTVDLAPRLLAWKG